MEDVWIFMAGLLIGSVITFICYAAHEATKDGKPL